MRPCRQAFETFGARGYTFLHKRMVNKHERFAMEGLRHGGAA